MNSFRFKVIVDALKNGTTTPSALLQKSLQQINKLNPKINAVISLAKEEDLYKAAKKCSGHSQVSGIPILVKEVMDVKGLPTTLAAPVLQNLPGDIYKAPRAEDAVVVDKLRKKGALILGKTNTPAMGLDVQTFNEMYGTTNNPWDLERTAGGSSGGSAAAVATGMAPIAIGTDLGGSLRIPAAFCGVSSLRPSERRVSTIGHMPPVPAVTSAKEAMRIGALTVDCDAQAAFMEAVCDDFDIKKTEEAKPNQYQLYVTPRLPETPTDERIVDFMAGTLPAALTHAGFDVTVKSAPALDFTALHKTYKTFARVVTGEGCSQAALTNGKESRKEGAACLDEFLGPDAFWILPANSMLPYPHNPTHQPIVMHGVPSPVSYWRAAFSYISFMSVLPHPVLTLPVGTIDGLPISVQIIGRANDDERLIGLGKALEGVYTPSLSPMAEA